MCGEGVHVKKGKGIYMNEYSKCGKNWPLLADNWPHLLRGGGQLAPLRKILDTALIMVVLLFYCAFAVGYMELVDGGCELLLPL